VSYQSELREPLSDRGRLPTRTLEQLQSRLAETETLGTKAQAAIPQTEQGCEQHRCQLDKAHRGLEALQREARELLKQYEGELEPETCDRLERVVTEPPASWLKRLAEQAAEAREVITAAEDELTRPDSSESSWKSAEQQQAALAALAERFSRK
jgi:hypothetical protein